ncbi:UDP-N-acetylmuramate dehydrogenase [Roseospira marina]|uniref:UDP-N-acetylenolpyruvoylglucosamine reductase n=1 Tax=Roseospira marina TaxID=140057 RepID=A0A5M6I8I8_9PROT|nr:UDP-N-acetylmuramate dehydrogenase [Roseospira marina]KAA5604574.1 UDP-N-acetylmuramate dehydrogenase [Roseospira marina]MBB4315324.1 UDP-N-acetylmuramate dehydrogenase [Roseospira marina]MBB5088323.1 UDP-N-acetylmuramate dehydrogenase [Roseospira marina]
MMVAPRIGSSEHLIDRLPSVRGRLRPDAPLSSQTWFRVGGPAEVLFRPADAEDLAAFLAETPPEVPITVIGVGSNLLVRDGGVRGVVIRLMGGFADVRIAGSRVHAGGAALDATVAKVARDAGLEGLEFLSGIPGSIGGGVRMNAGAFGRELKDALVEVRVVDRSGRLFTVPADRLGLSYRHADAPPDWIFVEAVFQAQPGDPAAIAGRMDEIRAARQASQPVRGRTGGSTFANPPGAKAWELIDRAGCRGLRCGGAQVSELHCNFLINTGGATAADLEDLGEEVRRRVRDTSGVELRWEIRRIGEALAQPGEVEMNGAAWPGSTE